MIRQRHSWKKRKKNKKVKDENGKEMIRKRHSWKKRKKNKKVKDENGKEYIICFVNECEHCGLQEGSIYNNTYLNRYGKTVYFRNDMIISWDIVPPGGCDPMMKTTKIIKEEYFSLEDFKIE